VSDETKKDDKPKFYITLLYLGIREGRERSRMHEWAEIEGLPNDGEELPKDVKTRIYGKAKGKYNNIAAGASPGAIYKFEQDDPASNDKGSIYSHSAAYQGQWKNKEQVSEWQIESRAVDYAIDMKAKEKKENKRRKDMEPLDPICRAYHKAVGSQKTIILAEVMKYITTWKPEKSTSRDEDDDY